MPSSSGKPHPDAAVGGVLGQDLDVLECPPRKGRVDAERFDLPSTPGRRWSRNGTRTRCWRSTRYTTASIRAERCRVPRDQPCNLVRGGQMSILQQRVNGTFRITHHLPARHPGQQYENVAADAAVDCGGADRAGGANDRTTRWLAARPDASRRRSPVRRSCPQWTGDRVARLGRPRWRQPAGRPLAEPARPLVAAAEMYRVTRARPSVTLCGWRRLRKACAGT